MILHHHVAALARLASLLLFGAGPQPPAAAPDARYRDEVEAWRQKREADLRAPDGWLALAGLAWLHPGVNRFGSAPDDAIRLPAPAPPHAGQLTVAGAGITATLAPGVAAA